ncbi:MAG: hypothetical protein AB7S26_37310 [Sandaracinaceae bacterium]
MSIPAAPIGQLLVAQLKGVGWSTIASVGVHGILAIAILRAPVDAWTDDVYAPDTITIDVIAPDTVDPVVTPDATRDEARNELPAPVPERDDVVRDPRVMPDRPNQTASTVEVTPVPSTIEVPQIQQEPATREMTEEERRRAQAVITAALDPRRASSALGYNVTGPGPSRTGPPAGLGTTDRGPTGAELSAMHSSSLRQQAMARPWLSRTEPELHRQADGSLVYSGHRFTVRIAPDGSLHWDDRPGVQVNGLNGSGPVNGGGSFDLSDALMGAQGQDASFAEREWFLEHTREIRERLEDEYEAGVRRTGLRRLRGRLARDWANTSHSLRARHTRLFSYWDEMSEDGSSEEERRAVIAFIRENLPQGSEDAYTDEEIERLNARRESHQRFEPY